MKYNDDISKQEVPHFFDLFHQVDYADDFGYSPEWNQEIEKWLAFVERKDSEFYKRQRNRVRTKKQRDELLGEYKAAYYVEEIAGGKILEFEPSGTGGKRLDLRFADKHGVEWHAEVKSPSWENEVVEEINWRYLKDLKGRVRPFKPLGLDGLQSTIPCPNCGADVVFEVRQPISDESVFDEYVKNAKCTACKNTVWKLTEDKRAKLIRMRLDQPQYIGETRCISISNAIRDPVKNSVEKFSPEGNNLLIITPNMFAGTVDLSAPFNGQQVREIVGRFDSQNLIEQVLILEVVLGDAIRYRTNYVTISSK
ncbi:MAG: hypothetical protein M1587_02330 [Thaumarchaeota archaeon]|nr:hypothetical protein [Nitrososphaerota archaeon]